MRFYVHSLVNSWWFILMISSFTASRMMNILSICVLFLMSCTRHVCSVTLRSAPFAPIECFFLVMLLHRRALRWMRQRLLPSRAGHFRLRSRRFVVFLILHVPTGVSCGISAPLLHVTPLVFNSLSICTNQDFRDHLHAYTCILIDLLAVESKRIKKNG